MKGFWKQNWIGIIGAMASIIGLLLMILFNSGVGYQMPELIKEYWPLMLFIVFYFPVQAVILYNILRWDNERRIEKQSDEKAATKAREVYLKENIETRKISDYIWDRKDGTFERQDPQYPNAKALYPLAARKEDFDYRNPRLNYVECSKCRVSLYLTAQPDSNEEGMHCPECKQTITKEDARRFTTNAENAWRGEIKKLIEEYYKEVKHGTADKIC